MRLTLTCAWNNRPLIVQNKVMTWRTLSLMKSLLVVIGIFAQGDYSFHPVHTQDDDSRMCCGILMVF